MNILKSMCRLTVVLILTLIVVSVADAKTFYVSKNGSDKNNGLKSRNAFLTIRKAAQSAKNNDVVIVDSGTYADAVDVTGKTKEQQLVFQVAQSATVVISGPVKIVNSNNIVFNGFQFAVPSDRACRHARRLRLYVYQLPIHRRSTTVTAARRKSDV